MLLSDFDFELPPELIAQEPLPERSASRMLALDRRSSSFRDECFVDLPSHLHAGDVLVLNNSRVFPARLLGRRSGQRAQAVSPRNPAARDFLQGEIEVLLVRQLGNNEWESLVRPGRKLGIGEMLRFGSDESGAPLLEAEIVDRCEFGERCLRFRSVSDFFARLEKIGHTPLPPYIGREDRSSDRERYQTVFGSKTGSSAAPTAGLHFTPEILDRIRVRQVQIAEITLHVGLGTFQPLRHERVEENALHVENYELSSEAAQTINSALAEGRRIVAVGTTVVRTLEHLGRQHGGRVAPGLGETDIFIYPGFEFRVVRAMLTNFHLPQSSLLMLVSAFAGREHVLAAYRHAVDSRYRFFSYGDCMWIE